MRVFLGMCLTVALAADVGAADDDCSLIPQMMGVDRYESRGLEQLYDYVYSNYCDGENVRLNVSIDTGAEAVIEYVPVKGNFSFGGAKEKLRHICKTRSEHKESLSTYETVELKVVREALAAFNECRDMQKTRLVFLQKDPSTFSIGLQLRSSRNPVFFTGLELGGPYASSVSCYAPPAPDNPAKSVTINRDTRAKLSDSLWTITCHREMQRIEGKDEGYYPGVTVQVSTDERNLMLALPRSTYFGPETSDEMRRLLVALENRHSDALSRIRSIRFYDSGVERGAAGFRDWKNGSTKTAKADFCALTRAFYTQWNKPEYGDNGFECRINHDAEKHTWTLMTKGADSTATVCQMVCFGAEDN